MPELPEVETTRLGLAPHLEGRRILSVTLRRPDLRWSIPSEIEALAPGQVIRGLRRRAKYLLMDSVDRQNQGLGILTVGRSRGSADGALRVDRE